VISRNGSAVAPMLDRVRSDMIETCAPGPLRLVGHTRGRTLADNAPEVMVSMLTNIAVPTGLTRRRIWDSP
jgi:hypothetical protein